jgi:hypothetical protein
MSSPRPTTPSIPDIDIEKTTTIDTSKVSIYDINGREKQGESISIHAEDPYLVSDFPPYF